VIEFGEVRWLVRDNPDHDTHSPPTVRVLQQARKSPWYPNEWVWVDVPTVEERITSRAP
jgi:hypothetical protein